MGNLQGPDQAGIVNLGKRNYGYGRVSTEDQNLDSQFEALKCMGIFEDRIYYDVESGTSIYRKGYGQLCHLICMGKVGRVTVYRIDRLGRDHYELISFFMLIEKHGVELESICEPFVKDWNKSSWAFRATWDAIGDARYELMRLKERQRRGIDVQQELIRRGLRKRPMGRPRRNLHEAGIL